MPNLTVSSDVDAFMQSADKQEMQNRINNATGTNAVAFGFYNTASGTYSSAVGYNNSASGPLQLQRYSCCENNC